MTLPEAIVKVGEMLREVFMVWAFAYTIVGIAQMLNSGGKR